MLNFIVSTGSWSGEEPDNKRPSTEPNTSLDSSSSSTRSYHLAPQQPLLETSLETRRRPLSWAGNGRGKGGLLEAGADLGLLQSHRMSHVAETGQLGPRIRRAESQIDKRAGAANVQPLVLETQSEPESAHRSNSMKPKKLGGMKQRQSTRSSRPSVKTTVPTAIPTTRTPDSEPDYHFMHLHAAPSAPAPVPRGLFETPMPTYLDNMSDTSSELDLGAVQDVERAKFVEESCSRPPPLEADTSDQPNHPRRSFQADRSSRVLRKVNSSFQVLKPGTLGPAEPAMAEIPAVRTNRAGHARRHSRKLYKQQALTESRRSSFIEIIYGNERH